MGKTLSLEMDPFTSLRSLLNYYQRVLSRRRNFKRTDASSFVSLDNDPVHSYIVILLFPLSPSQELRHVCILSFPLQRERSRFLCRARLTRLYRNWDKGYVHSYGIRNQG
jgi:hypothetical protein